MNTRPPNFASARPSTALSATLTRASANSGAVRAMSTQAITPRRVDGTAAAERDDERSTDQRDHRRRQQPPDHEPAQGQRRHRERQDHPLPALLEQHEADDPTAEHGGDRQGAGDDGRALRREIDVVDDRTLDQREHEAQQQRHERTGEQDRIAAELAQIVAQQRARGPSRNSDVHVPSGPIT